MFWPLSRGATTLLFDEPAHANMPPTFGPYRVLHQIGSGVLGPVFRTHDARQDRLVAVKALALDLTPEQADTLAEALRGLVRTAPEHRSAVSVFDAGLEGYTPYLAMTFETRETLDQLLRRGEAGPVDRVAALIAQLAEVIDVFAKEECLHGGLHPRDVFVTASGTGVRVTGFGVSQALAAAGVRWPGRRPYAAPERAGREWDTRADVYALAAIAHELLTGRRPMGTGEQAGELSDAVTLTQRPRLRRVLAAGLAERPEQRFATAAAFSAAVSEALGQTLESGTTRDEPPRAEPTDVTPAAAWTMRDEPVQPADDLVLRSGSLPFTDLEMASSGSPGDDAALMEATPWDEDAIEAPPPVAPRRWDGIAAVALAGLALGALIVVAGVRGVSPGPSAPEPPQEAAAAPAPAAAAPAASDVRDLSSADVAPANSADPIEPAAAPGTASAPAAAAPAIDPEPAPALAPAAAPAAPGRLLVESEPAGALVTVNGLRVGGTPVTARNLPLGTHNVQVARPGYVPVRTTITLSPDAPAQSVRLTLEPGLPQPGVAPPAGPPGAIDVDSRPRGARVSIDGRFVGTAPLRLADLEPGTHALTLELSGYDDARRRVQVEPGEVSRLVVDLE